MKSSSELSTGVISENENKTQQDYLGLWFRYTLSHENILDIFTYKQLENNIILKCCSSNIFMIGPI